MLIQIKNDVQVHRSAILNLNPIHSVSSRGGTCSQTDGLLPQLHVNFMHFMQETYKM